MVKTTIQIVKPAGFNFQRTVLSHGWYSLPPFSLDREKWILTRVFELQSAAPVAAEIADADDFIELSINGEIDSQNLNEIVRQARHILRLDEDFAAFYALLDNEAELVWIAERGAGRLLRSPTVWEDLIKSICTTNCSWALTQKMVNNLVEKLGTPTADGAFKSFPTAAQMAAQSTEFYKDEIRAGYRAAYFKELADKAASGAVDVESWATTVVSTAELKKQVKQIKGVGDYAAENLLKLLGRYDGLALDSWLRMRFANKHNSGEKCADNQIRGHYERFGEWRGLAIWCDMTKDWL